MDAKRKESMSIMKKIMIAMVTGILLGVVCLWLRESLTAGGNEGTWKLINRIFFQDITQEKGFYSLGLFYIIQQLFMRGLQLAIVPLVLSSLSLALCSMADSKRLGKIVGKTIGTFVGFYVCGATAAGTNITPPQLITAAFLSICVAMGTPAIPVAGTTLIFVIMSGLGLSSDLCMVAYALVLAISYLPGMAVITLNVVGDAATTVIVSYKENELDKDVYNS